MVQLRGIVLADEGNRAPPPALQAACQSQDVHIPVMSQLRRGHGVVGAEHGRALAGTQAVVDCGLLARRTDPAKRRERGHAYGVSFSFML